MIRNLKVTHEDPWIKPHIGPVDPPTTQSTHHQLWINRLFLRFNAVSPWVSVYERITFDRMQLLGHLHVTSLLVSSFDRDVTCNLVTKNPSGIDVRHLLTRLSRPQVNNQTNEMNGRDVKKRVQ